MLALAFGAFAIGFAPVFAAFALKPEYGGFGPASIGFYRILFALPLMWLVLWITPSKSDSLSKSQKRPIGLLALSGVFFAIDLVSWHWSIKYTSIANATLLANFAPLWVTLWARHLFGEKIHTRFFIALGIAIIGATILMRTSFQLKPEQLLGDLLSLLTAISYGSYMLTVKKLRETCPPQQIMAWSGLFAVPIMFFAAIHQNNQFCLITREATEKVSAIHHREPLIINQSQINNYLNVKKDAMEILKSIKPVSYTHLTLPTKA